MSLPHFMMAKSPSKEPAPIQGKPDTSRIHEQHAGGKLNPFPGEAVVAKFRDPPPEKPESNFVPLDTAESIRYDEEIAAMKEFGARFGLTEVPSRFWDDRDAKAYCAEGLSPRDMSKQRIVERLGIHKISFRPVTSSSSKSFEDYRELAKKWKQQHGIEISDEVPPRAVDRPSIISEYINNNAPIVSRSGSQLTSVNRDRREQAQKNRKPQPHLVASYFADDFEHGPASDNPAPGFRNAKASFQKEKELVQRLVERLQGKTPTKFSPQRIEGLAVPLTAEMRAARVAEAERSRSRHTDPGSVSSLHSSASRLRNNLDGPKRPLQWR